MDLVELQFDRNNEEREDHEKSRKEDAKECDNESTSVPVVKDEMTFAMLWVIAILSPASEQRDRRDKDGISPDEGDLEASDHASPLGVQAVGGEGGDAEVEGDDGEAGEVSKGPDIVEGSSGM